MLPVATPRTEWLSFIGWLAPLVSGVRLRWSGPAGGILGPGPGASHGADDLHGADLRGRRRLGRAPAVRSRGHQRFFLWHQQEWESQKGFMGKSTGNDGVHTQN